MKRTRLMLYLSAGRRVLMFKSLPRHPPSSTHPDVVLVRVCDRLTAIVSHGALATDDNSPKSAESPAELLGLGLGLLGAEPSVRHGVRGAGGRRRLPEFTPGKLGESYDVKERGSTAADNGEVGGPGFFIQSGNVTT